MIVGNNTNENNGNIDTVINHKNMTIVMIIITYNIITTIIIIIDYITIFKDDYVITYNIITIGKW